MISFHQSYWFSLIYLTFSNFIESDIQIHYWTKDFIKIEFIFHFDEENSFNELKKIAIDWLTCEEENQYKIDIFRNMSDSNLEIIISKNISITIALIHMKKTLYSILVIIVRDYLRI